MAITHTSAPWTATLADNDVACLHDRDGRHFANLRNVRGDGRAILEKDAQIAAAGPELLAALKALLFNSRHGNGLEAHHQAHDRADAAIAKAEGCANG